MEIPLGHDHMAWGSDFATSSLEHSSNLEDLIRFGQIGESTPKCHSISLDFLGSCYAPLPTRKNTSPQDGPCLSLLFKNAIFELDATIIRETASGCLAYGGLGVITYTLAAEKSKRKV